MTKIISDTTTLVTGKPGAQETVPPGEPADVHPNTAERLIARGQFREYTPPGKSKAAKQSDPSTDDPVAKLLSGSVKDIAGEVPDLDDEALAQVRAAEAAADKPRKGVLDAIDAEVQARADSGN